VINTGIYYELIRYSHLELAFFLAAILSLALFKANLNTHLILAIAKECVNEYIA